MSQRSRCYQQAAAQLVVNGLPDVSAGQGEETISIVTGWTLDLVGQPQLEGKREHLQSMVAAVLPYARHLLSEVRLTCGASDDPVSIGPASQGHSLTLRSSVLGTDPFTIDLDDGELADLVRCLDGIRQDPLLAVDFPLAPDRPLPRRELRERVPLRQRLSAPLLGLGSAVAVATLAITIPLPRSLEPEGLRPAPAGDTVDVAPGGEGG